MVFILQMRETEALLTSEQVEATRNDPTVV